VRIETTDAINQALAEQSFTSPFGLVRIETSIAGSEQFGNQLRFTSPFGLVRIETRTPSPPYCPSRWVSFGLVRIETADAASYVSLNGWFHQPFWAGAD